jgi:hypothetical protein
LSFRTAGTETFLLVQTEPKKFSNLVSFGKKMLVVKPILAAVVLVAIPLITILSLYRSSTLPVTQDTFVGPAGCSGTCCANGGDNFFNVRNSVCLDPCSFVQDGYIMINITTAPKTFTHAVVTLNIVSGDDDNGKTCTVYNTGTSWSESTLTYCPSGSTCTACPPAFGTSLGVFTVSSNTLVFDATTSFQNAITNGATEIAFVLSRKGYPDNPAIWIHFASHESGNGGYVTFS